MVRKGGVDKPYKSKVKISKEAQRQYSLRHRQSVSYNEAVLSCVNAVLDDEITLERCNGNKTSHAGEATLKNDFQRGFHEKRPATTSSTFQKIKTVLHPVGDLTTSVTYNVSQTISCKEVKITNHNHATFTEANSSEVLGKTSTDVSDVEKVNSSLCNGESDTASKSDIWSDMEDNGKWVKDRAILTQIKSGQVNRRMSICEVCGTGFCRKGDLNAHMIIAHHQKVHQTYKKSWDIEPSMPKLTREKNVNTLPHPQKCENPDTDVHTMPVLPCELPFDFTPSLSKTPMPNIPKQKCEALQHPVQKYEALEHLVQKCEDPQNSVPSTRQQKCSQNDPGMSKLKHENFQIPLQDKQINYIEKRYGSSLLQPKCEISDNSTGPKCEGFSKVKCNPPLPKCIAADHVVYTKTGWACNTTQTYTVLSESNVQKWNIYNGNGTWTSECNETEIHSDSFSLSRKLCTSDMENISGWDSNGNLVESITPLLHCSGRQMESCSGSQMESCSGRHMESCSGSQMESCSGRHMESCSGSQMESCSGSHMESCSGRHMESCSGSQMESCSGSHMESCPGSQMESCSGSHMESCSGRHMESCPGSHMESGSGIQMERNGSKDAEIRKSNTFYRPSLEQKQHDKENLYSHEKNFKYGMNESVSGIVSNSASFTGSSRATYKMTSASSSSSISLSSSNYSASEFDYYMVLPGRQHVKISHRLQKCQLCGKGFSRLSDLTSHSLTHHSNNQRSSCYPQLEANTTSPVSACNLKTKCRRGRPKKNNFQMFPFENYDIQNKVRAGLRGRQGEMHHQTGHCDVKALKTSHRGRPRNIVTFPPPREPTDNEKLCPICRRLFPTTSCLQAHLRVHTGEKPFQCTYCKKSFSQKGNLKIHMWIHTKERPYQCSTCSSTFNQLNLLNYHRMKKHDLERE